MQPCAAISTIFGDRCFSTGLLLRRQANRGVRSACGGVAALGCGVFRPELLFAPPAADRPLAATGTRPFRLTIASQPKQDLETSPFSLPFSQSIHSPLVPDSSSILTSFSYRQGYHHSLDQLHHRSPVKTFIVSVAPQQLPPQWLNLPARVT